VTGEHSLGGQARCVHTSTPAHALHPKNPLHTPMTGSSGDTGACTTPMPAALHPAPEATSLHWHDEPPLGPAFSPRCTNKEGTGTSRVDAISNTTAGPAAATRTQYWVPVRRPQLEQIVGGGGGRGQS
jgi:hypothetical protein